MAREQTEVESLSDDSTLVKSSEETTSAILGRNVAEVLLNCSILSFLSQGFFMLHGTVESIREAGGELSG